MHNTYTHTRTHTRARTHARMHGTKSPNDSTFVWPATAYLSCQEYSLIRMFPVVGPTIWNALGNDLRNPDLSIAHFNRLVKTHVVHQYSVHWAH